MNQKIVPRLWLHGRAEVAARFYVSAFTASGIAGIVRPGEPDAKPPGKARGMATSVAYEIEGRRFLVSGGGPALAFPPAISLTVACPTAIEFDRLYGALSSGDRRLPLSLGSGPFCERSAWFTDRYGLPWRLSLGCARRKITPTLLFVGKRYGGAEEAMRFYVSVFDGSKVETVVLHEKGKGEKEGAVKYAVFSLGGERFIAMDSGLDHRLAFTPAISFAVKCESRDETEYFRSRLGAAPHARRGGLVQDKFGIFWQLLPH
jgi:predicted 3-demethylubiquinone-9 3-methyltransferase (glyoxalase superfamily)